MQGAGAEALSLVLLLAVLVMAVWRPRGLPEAVAAVPAALVVLATGALTHRHAVAELRRLGPVIGFLAAVLVLAGCCAREGLFEAIGSLVARRSGRDPRRLLTSVFATAALVTAGLSLDATVVLLTPVVFATAARLGARPRPHVYACTHLANSGSLLLPVSNLTNLLAFATSGLSFARFAALMAVPWLGAVLVEWAVFRRFFAADLVPDAATTRTDEVALPLPRFAAAVTALTLLALALSSPLHVAAVWPAAAGAVVLAAGSVARGRMRAADVVLAADVPFCVFVLALGLVVRAVSDHGLSRLVGALVPSGAGLVSLLAVAGVAALLANLLNNLPAVLLLLPVVAHGGAGPVLAAVLGVNIGPNLTYVGSLATLLWRRTVATFGVQPSVWRFTRLGLLTVPPTLGVAVVGLWGGLRLLG